MATNAMLFGLVVAPMGWVLILAATVAPQWREFAQKSGFSQDVSFSDGLWESCMEVTSLQGKICHPVSEKMALSWPIQMVRALTVTSVLVGFLGYILTHTGTRWWSESPNYQLTGGSGLLVLISGVMYLCATSYMAYRSLVDLLQAQGPSEDKYQIGTCLYLGWSGGAAEIVAGACLASSFHRKNDHSLRSLSVPYYVDY